METVSFKFPSLFIVKFDFKAMIKNKIFNPNLPDPVNFVPFGMMRCSIFDINLMGLTCI